MNLALAPCDFFLAGCHKWFGSHLPLGIAFCPNPATQAEKFVALGMYRKRFIAEMSRDPGPEALAYFEATPRNWRLDPNAPYPARIIALFEGRDRALAAYGLRKA